MTHTIETRSRRTIDRIHGRIPTFVLVIIGVVVLVGLALYLWPRIMGAFTTDGEPVDDSDLVPSVVEAVPDELNAYFALEELAQSLAEQPVDAQEVVDYVTGERAWNQQRAAEIILAHDDVLANWMSFTSVPYYQDPTLNDPANVSFTMVIQNLGGLRHAAALGLLVGAHELRQGNHESAMQYLAAPMITGDKITQPNATIIVHLVAIAIQQLSYDALLHLRGEGLLTKRDATVLLDYLRIHPGPNIDALANALQIEYMSMRNALDDINERQASAVAHLHCSQGSADDYETCFADAEDKYARFDSNYYYRPNDTQAMFADLARQQVAATETYCTDPQPFELADVRISEQSVLSMYLTENLIGHMLYSVTASSLQGIFERYCQHMVNKGEVLDALVTTAQQ